MQKRNEVPMMITLSDKRLLSVAEFCTYSSIGREKGMEMALAAGAVFRIGKRVTIDRVKFDRWCDDNTEID